MIKPLPIEYKEAEFRVQVYLDKIQMTPAESIIAIKLQEVIEAINGK